MLKHLLLLLFGMVAVSLQAQTFHDIQAGLTGVSESTSNWIDYDDDGDLDVMVTGEFYTKSGHYIKTKFYRNDRHDRFTKINTPVVDVFRGDFDWADYDLDGDLDLFITGEDPAGKYIAKLYRNNNRTSAFSPVFTGIPGVVDGSVDWGDFDGDGDDDLLITGKTTKGLISRIYRNDRNSRFSLVKTDFPGLHFGTGKFADYDNDGDLDVILSGTTEKGLIVTEIFKNSKGKFIKTKMGLMPLKLSDIAWGDYDNDGDEDFVINGESADGKFQTRLYNNNDNLYFTMVYPHFAAVRSGSVDWGDFDHDGDLDLLLTGEAYNGPVSIIYRNDRKGVFTDIHAQLIGLYMSDGHFGDYDNDGDLDVIISGMSLNYQFISRIYRNDPVIKKDTAKKVKANSIYDSKYYNYERPEKIYFFVYSSGYFDMDGDGKKEYSAFVSTIKKPVKQYEMEQAFRDYIIKNYPQWPLIDQGNIIQNGFVKLKDAQQSRKRIINEYKNKKFKVYTVDW
jgi:hypothetical protein